MLHFIRKNNDNHVSLEKTIFLLKTCKLVTILTPVEKDSSVTMDSGAKLDAVGGGGT